MKQPPEKRNRPDGGGSEVAIAGGDDFQGHDGSAAVDLQHAEQFLSVIDAGAEAWSFRTFAEPQGGGGRKYSGTLDDVGLRLQLDNGKSRGAFVVVNEGGHDDASITRIRAVFADFDGTPLPDHFELEPHLIVQSSPDKWHAYWLVDGLSVSEFKPTQQAIAAKFGTDPSVCNPSRIMRLPGFIHHKGAPFRTTIIHESGGLPYQADAIRVAFRAQPPPPAHISQARGADGIHVDSARHADVLKLAGRLAGEVHRGMSMEAALAAMFAEAKRGRWTREVTADEMQRALVGAVAKFGTGEWTARADAADTPESAAPRLVGVSLSGLMHAPPESPQYVIQPVVPRGVVTLLGGHGGAGKSMLALTMAAHVASGWSLFGWQVTPGIVLFVSLEDPGAVVRHRLRKIIQTHGFDAGLIADRVRVIDGTDADAALMTEINEFGSRHMVVTPAMLEVESAAEGADLIVIDNASDAFDGNENERRAVRQFVRKLAQIAKRNNSGLVLLAHINKAAATTGAIGNSYSGSTAWHNSARSRLAMIPDAGGFVEVLHEKHQHGKCAEPVLLAWSEDGVLEQGHRVGLAVGGDADDDAAEVLRLLEIANAAGLTVPTAISGPHTAWHVLDALAEFPERFRKGEGKRRFRAGIVRLAREKKITRQTFRTANRKERERWALAQSGGPDAA